MYTHKTNTFIYWWSFSMTCQFLHLFLFNNENLIWKWELFNITVDQRTAEILIKSGNQNLIVICCYYCYLIQAHSSFPKFVFILFFYDGPTLGGHLFTTIYGLYFSHHYMNITDCNFYKHCDQLQSWNQRALLQNETN